MGKGVFRALQGSETIQLYKIVESSELYSMTERKSGLYPEKSHHSAGRPDLGEEIVPTSAAVTII